VARPLLEQGLALGRQCGLEIAEILRLLGMIALEQVDFLSANRYFQESLERFRAAGDPLGIAWSLLCLTDSAWREGVREGDAAHRRQVMSDHGALCEEALELFRAADFRSGIAWGLQHLGGVAMELGELARSRSAVEESVRLFRELNDRHGMAWALHDLGVTLTSLGDYPEARESLQESLATFEELGEKDGTAWVLERLAVLAASEGPAESATWLTVARMYGAAAALREATGAPLPPVLRACYAHSQTAARTALGEDRFVAAWAEGCSMSMEEAIAWALEPGRPQAAN
jgi:tetratricopeptide (TPR) repeat protein